MFVLMDVLIGSETCVTSDFFVKDLKTNFMWELKIFCIYFNKKMGSFCDYLVSECLCNFFEV